MKINKVFLTVILCFFSLSMWSQSGNMDVIKTHYPEVYASIQSVALKQWDDVQVRQAVMEGQAKAFLALAESQDPMDSGVLAEAILNNSLPNQKDYNTSVLNDLSVDNPFPKLKCDWFKVKAYYDRRVSKQYTAEVKERQTPPARSTVVQTSPSKTTVSKSSVSKRPQSETSTQRGSVTERKRVPVIVEREPEVEEPVMNEVEVEQPDIFVEAAPVQPSSQNRQDTSRDSYFDQNNNSQTPDYENYDFEEDGKSSPIHIGIKLGGGLGSMYNLGSYLNRPAEDNIPANMQLKSKIGLQGEAGLAFMYKAGGLFVQNETGVVYSDAKFTSKIYGSADGVKEKNFNNTYLFLQTAFHVGGYYELYDGLHLIAGVGPYVGFKLNSSYANYGFWEQTELEEGQKPPYKDYMEKGEKSIMFGASGVFGADINKFRIALYPSMGLSKMHDKEKYKPFGVTLGLTYWFF